MTRLPMTCTACGKPLTGGIDTFSDIQHPMCWDCHSSLLFEDVPDEQWGATFKRLQREEWDWLDKYNQPAPTRWWVRVWRWVRGWFR
jgi:hypothetical protein